MKEMYADSHCFTAHPADFGKASGSRSTTKLAVSIQENELPAHDAEFEFRRQLWKSRSSDGGVDCKAQFLQGTPD